MEPRRTRPGGPVRTWLAWGLLVLLLGAMAWAGAFYWKRRGRVELQATTEKQESDRQLSQTRALTAEKDSLLAEMLETTAVITDISQAVTELQGGRNAPMLQEEGKPLTARQARALLMPKIDALRIRLNAAETRLTASLARVHEMSGVETQLRAQIAKYEQTVESVRHLMASQQEQLTTLGAEVTSLRADNRRLLDAQSKSAAEQVALQDSLAGLKEGENTVYWIAGSRSSLIELGVVVEEGKGKFLVFGKGKSLEPARGLQSSDFTAINKRQDLTINLPKPDVRYRIISRQNLSGAAPLLDANGHVRGVIHIIAPASFWAPSAFLILVEDN